MTQRKHEAPEIGAMIGRMLKSLTRRAAEGDLEAIEQLAALQGTAADALRAGAQGAHAFGYSWTELAAATGTTRQAARQRFAAK
jgi:hypothetical protein